MTLDERMRRDLIARGAFACEPEARDEFIAAIVERIDEALWDRVVGYCDTMADGRIRVAASMLYAGFQSPEAWADLVDCARSAARFYAARSIPSHYNAGPPPSGACRHGTPGTKPCVECDPPVTAPKAAKPKAAAKPVDPAPFRSAVRQGGMPAAGRWLRQRFGAEMDTIDGRADVMRRLGMDKLPGDRKQFMAALAATQEDRADG